MTVQAIGSVHRLAPAGAVLAVSAGALLLGGRLAARAAVRVLRWRARQMQRASGAVPGSTAPSPDQGRPPLILAFGDSLIAGYGLGEEQCFASQLERLLQVAWPGCRVIRAGRCGDTSSSARMRLRQLLAQLEDIPDLAIVQIGANDLISGVPLRTIRANLEAIVTELGEASVPVLLGQIRAPFWFGPYGWACAAIYARLSRRPGVRCAPFFPKGFFANPRHCLPDRIHPNAAATTAIAVGFAPAVLDYIDKIR